MATKRRTTVVVSALAFVTLAFLAGGCSESPQGACERVFDHFADCASPGEIPDEFDLFVALLCGSIPDTSECQDWSEFANCLTSVSCSEFEPSDLQTLEACQEIQVRLENNDCFPTTLGF